jgi:hypothetical protein
MAKKTIHLSRGKRQEIMNRVDQLTARYWQMHRLGAIPKDLGDRVYESCIPLKVRRAADQAMVDLREATFDDDVNALVVNDSMLTSASISLELKMEDGSGPTGRLYMPSPHIINTNGHNLVVHPSHSIYTEMLERWYVDTEMKCLLSRTCAVIRGVLSEYNTVGQLLRDWPAFVDYIPYGQQSNKSRGKNELEAHWGQRSITPETAQTVLATCLMLKDCARTDYKLF